MLKIWTIACLCGILPLVAAASAMDLAPTLPPENIDQPKDATHSQPATTTPASAGDNLATIRKMLTLSQEEMQVLAGVTDRNRQLAGPSFDMMLAKVAALPKLDSDDWDQLNRPSYQNLLARPEQFRGNPKRGAPYPPLMTVRMRVMVYRVKKVAPAELAEHSAATQWGSSIPTIYRLDALHSDEGASPLPLIIFVTQVPDLGKPDSIESGGAEIYLKGKPLEVAAVFYKLLQYDSISAGEQTAPVLVAWQLAEARSRATLFDRKLLMLLAFILLLGVMLGAVVAKLKRPRDWQAKTTAQSFRPSADAGADVDPKLQAAVEDYQRRHPHDGSAKH